MAKFVSSPLSVHMQLNSEQYPITDEDKKTMKIVHYSSAVGSLIYTMVYTKPDIAHVIGVVSKFMSNPRKECWASVKRILKYLRGTSRISLCFGHGEPALDDSDDIDSSKFSSGYMMTFAGGCYFLAIKIAKMCCSIN